MHTHILCLFSGFFLLMVYMRLRDSGICLFPPLFSTYHFHYFNSYVYVCSLATLVVELSKDKQINNLLFFIYTTIISLRYTWSKWMDGWIHSHKSNGLIIWSGHTIKYCLLQLRMFPISQILIGFFLSLPSLSTFEIHTNISDEQIKPGCKKSLPLLLLLLLLLLLALHFISFKTNLVVSTHTHKY